MSFIAFDYSTTETIVIKVAQISGIKFFTDEAEILFEDRFIKFVGNVEDIKKLKENILAILSSKNSPSLSVISLGKSIAAEDLHEYDDDDDDDD